MPAAESGTGTTAPVSGDATAEGGAVPAAIVLYGHGARDAEWARPFHRLRDRLTARRPGLVVELAFLEFMSPSLAQVMSRLADSGVRDVRVLPVFISQGGHVKADVNRLVDVERERHPQLAIEQLTAIGEVEAVLDAIADHALAASDASRGEGRPGRAGGHPA